MKISKRSWHFKLYTFWCQTWDWDSPLDWFNWARLLLRRDSLRLDKYKPRSLCSYFWLIVLFTTLSWLVLIVAGVVILVVLAIAYPIFLYIESDWRMRRVAAKQTKRREKGKEPKGPGLLRSFFRAWKNKLCPIIEVVD